MNAVLRAASNHCTTGALQSSIAALIAVIAVAAASAAGQARPSSVDADGRPRFKAVVFDANSVVGAADQAFPGKGQELAQLWRTRQFEYAWLRSITGRYVDFFAVTEDALVYSASAMKLELTREGLEDAQQRGPSWVALANGVPVGFAHIELLEPGIAHLEEIDVYPEHGRRGLGRRLLSTVCRWAATNGYSWVTLTTFRDVPWNMPFYARLGSRRFR